MIKSRVFKSFLFKRKLYVIFYICKIYIKKELYCILELKKCERVLLLRIYTRVGFLTFLLDSDNPEKSYFQKKHTHTQTRTYLYMNYASDLLQKWVRIVYML